MAKDEQFIDKDRTLKGAYYDTEVTQTTEKY